MFRVTLQVYLRCLGSLYRCIYDVPGHFTVVFTKFRVTLQVYLRCLGSLYRCIYDVPVTLQVYSRYPGSLYRCIHDVSGHFTGVFSISWVTLQVYLRCPGSVYRCIHDIKYCNLQMMQPFCNFLKVIYFYLPVL